MPPAGAAAPRRRACRRLRLRRQPSLHHLHGASLRCLPYLDLRRHPVGERCQVRHDADHAVMGLQSLEPAEQRRAGRRYAPEVVDRPIEVIEAQSLAHFNNDQI